MQEQKKLCITSKICANSMLAVDMKMQQWVIRLEAIRTQVGQRATVREALATIRSKKKRFELGAGLVDPNTLPPPVISIKLKPSTNSYLHISAFTHQCLAFPLLCSLSGERDLALAWKVTDFPATHISWISLELFGPNCSWSGQALTPAPTATKE